MFALGDISRFKGEKETCKILKPVWDVVTDYLVISLALLSILFAGMEVTSSSFECLAAVDCAGISRPNTSVLLSHTMNRSACKAFYRSQKTNVIKKTVVVTDLQSSLQYVKFINSECSKSAIPDFLAYFWLVLFTEAFVLIALDNLWLKLPITASAIENFVELVMTCYASPIPNYALTQALSDIPATRRQAVDHQQSNEIETANLIRAHNDSDNECGNDESYEYNILEDPAIISAIKTLYEKVQALKKDIKSSHKIVKIWHLYLLQSVLQAIFTFAFIIINAYFMKDLQGTMTCTVTQYIPVPHDYFICSHGLAPAFLWGLHIYLIILGLCFLIFMGIIGWMVKIIYKCRCTGGKKCKSRCEYVFRENELPGTKLADISDEDGDFGFLLHLLHHYNHVYVNRLAHFLSKKNIRKIEIHYVTKYYPFTELRKKLYEDKGKVTFSKLRAIPQTIFQLATEIRELELIGCGPLENEDFDNFWKFTYVQTLSVVKCGLKCIPDGILEMEWLHSLNLKGNHIISIDCDIFNLKNLARIDLSHNRLKNVTPDLKMLEKVFSMALSGNPEFTVQSLKVVLALPRLRILYPSQHMFQEAEKLNHWEQDKFNKVVGRGEIECYVCPYTPESAPCYIDIDSNEKIYKMDSCPKGMAIIFNNVSYKDTQYDDRCNSGEDDKQLESLFKQIGFDTLCCTDYKGKQAKQFLEKCATDEKYKDCDCIVVCVLSHGAKDGLVFPDGEVVPVMDLLRCVQKSSLYEGKPKLFFIQSYASRGGQVPGRHIWDDDLLRDVHVMTGVDIPVPEEADILLSYSRMSGYALFNNIRHDSWYVQSLTKIFSRHAWAEDVVSLLTLVNYETVKTCTIPEWKKLAPPQSTLRKKLYFLPGYPQQKTTCV